jgi:hypothetical protein
VNLGSAVAGARGPWLDFATPLSCQDAEQPHKGSPGLGSGTFTDVLSSGVVMPSDPGACSAQMRSAAACAVDDTLVQSSLLFTSVRGPDDTSHGRPTASHSVAFTVDTCDIHTRFSATGASDADHAAADTGPNAATHSAHASRLSNTSVSSEGTPESSQNSVEGTSAISDEPAEEADHPAVMPWWQRRASLVTSHPDFELIVNFLVMV